MSRTNLPCPTRSRRLDNSPFYRNGFFGKLGTAFLISRIWLLCSRMFPSRSAASDDVKMWLQPRHKCIICGVEVEFTQVGVHYQTTHPDYHQWGKHWKRLSWLLLISDVALVILDAFFIRSVIPYSQDIVLAYLLGSMLVIIFTLVSKQRAF